MAQAAVQRQGYPWEASYPKGVNWHEPIPVEPAYKLLDDSVARFPDNNALDFLDRKTTYRELGDLVARAAKGFQELGVVKGSKVGLFLPNCPYYVVCYFAILKLGAVVVNFNPLYAERELVKMIEDSETDIMVTLDLSVVYDKLAKMLRETRLKTIVVCKMANILPFPKNWLFPLVKRKEIAAIPQDDRHVPFARLTGNDGKFRPAPIDPIEDLAVLQYTGGTTGVPKGAMLTHSNIYANTAQCVMWFAGAEYGRERMLAALPFFHVFAMTVVMNLSLKFGAEIVMLPRFELEQVMETLSKKRITLFPAVPTIYTAINNFKGREKYDLTSLKFCFSGGAPLPVEVAQKFMSSTGCVLVEGYGLSESSPVVCGNPLDGRAKVGSIGLPMPGTIVDIVSLEDPTRLAQVGERGELCIRGPQVMKGYWGKPEETAKTLVDGRLHTGDVAVVDEEGFVYIVDRIKDMIIAGGYNIYPRNVEEALYLHPAIEECCVIGVPDEYRGQNVKAFIKLKAGQTVTKDELNAFLKDKLSVYEVPKIYEFRDELPKTNIGKLSRKALVDEENAKRAAKG